MGCCESKSKDNNNIAYFKKSPSAPSPSIKAISNRNNTNESTENLSYSYSNSSIIYNIKNIKDLDNDNKEDKHALIVAIVFEEEERVKVNTKCNLLRNILNRHMNYDDDDIFVITDNISEEEFKNMITNYLQDEKYNHHFIAILTDDKPQDYDKFTVTDDMMAQLLYTVPKNNTVIIYSDTNEFGVMPALKHRIISSDKYSEISPLESDTSDVNIKCKVVCLTGCRAEEYDDEEYMEAYGGLELELTELLCKFIAKESVTDYSWRQFCWHISDYLEEPLKISVSTNMNRFFNIKVMI